MSMAHAVDETRRVGEATAEVPTRSGQLRLVRPPDEVDQGRVEVPLSASELFWMHPGRWQLAKWMAVSALVQIAAVVAIHQAEHEPTSYKSVMLDDRFVSVMLRPSPKKEEEKEQPKAKEKEPEKPKEPEKKVEKPKPKPKPKKRKRPKRRKRRAKKAKPAPPAPPAPPKQATPPAPAPMAAAAAPLGMSSRSLLGNAIVIDMDMAATGMSGSLGGVPGGVAGGVPGGRVGGLPGGKAVDVARASYEVDRLPICPKIKPSFPEEAKREDAEGDVVLRLQIGHGGKVKRAKLKREAGYGFDEVALAAARRMRCKPAIQEGVKVAVWIDYEVAFRMVD